jgi:DNA mismatch repair protein MutH
MKLEEAYARFQYVAGIPFGELFVPSDLNTIIRNKGKAGQLLELALGMHLSNTTLDFEDGELKTNRCDAQGRPRETMFVTQISGMIDDLLRGQPFEQTHLYEKIRNLLYVPVCKEGHPRDWMFLPCIHIDLSTPRFSPLKAIWEKDYYTICQQLREHIETSPDGFIHTSNGHHLQIRSKDAKDWQGRYHPIYSQLYGRYVSNKNHAFYFRKQFVSDIRELAGREELCLQTS